MLDLGWIVKKPDKLGKKNDRPFRGGQKYLTLLTLSILVVENKLGGIMEFPVTNDFIMKVRAGRIAG